MKRGDSVLSVNENEKYKYIGGVFYDGVDSTLKEIHKQIPPEYTSKAHRTLIQEVETLDFFHKCLKDGIIKRDNYLRVASEYANGVNCSDTLKGWRKD